VVAVFPVLLWVSDVFCRLVDVPSVALGRWLEANRLLPSAVGGGSAPAGPGQKKCVHAKEKERWRGSVGRGFVHGVPQAGGRSATLTYRCRYPSPPPKIRSYNSNNEHETAQHDTQAAAGERGSSRDTRQHVSPLSPSISIPSVWQAGRYNLTSSPREWTSGPKLDTTTLPSPAGVHARHASSILSTSHAYPSCAHLLHSLTVQWCTQGTGQPLDRQGPCWIITSAEAAWEKRAGQVGALIVRR